MNKGIAMSLGILATGIALGLMTPANAASPSGGWGCVGSVANPTPCVVTHAEFNTLDRGMTKAAVRQDVGAPAHDDHTVYWSPDLADAFLIYKYRQSNGQWAYVTYVDKGGDGAGPLRLYRAEWLR